MSNYHIDDIFRESLRDYEVFPSSSVWENMELPQPLPFYRKPAFIISSVIGVLLLMGSIFFNTQKTKTTSNTNDTYSESPANQREAASQYFFNYSPNIKQVEENRKSISSEKFNNTADNTTNDIQTNHSKFEKETHTNLLTTGSSMSNQNAPELPSDIAYTPMLNFENSNPSPNFFTTILESKPVNAPFYLAPSLLEGLNLNFESTSNTTPPFSPYYLFAILSPFSQNTVPVEISEINNNISTDIETISSLPIAEVEEPEIDINAADKDLFVSSERDAIMARYNQQMDVTRGFHLGTFASAHNNWILNPALKETITPNSNLVHQLDFGYTYGVAMGYEFSNKWGLQMEWIVNSEQGQRFAKQAIFNSNNKSNTDINLTYTYFPVLLKYRNQRMFSLTKQPLVINYIAGIQYGMLKSAEININNPVVQDDLLQLSSWGFVWGLDYDFYLNKNYFLTFGARSSLSTSSDSKYKPVFPTTNTSNSLLIGLRASFNYQFD